MVWAMVSRQTRFCREFVPQAQEVCRLRGLPWQVCVVQAYTESGWGFRGLASDAHNNRWGIKAGRVAADGETTKLTTEFLKRGKVRIRGHFASWRSMTRGIHGWCDFLDRQRYRRPRIWGFEDDPARFVTWIWGKGYATAPRYVERFVRVSGKLADRIGDRSLRADIDPALARCLDEMRDVPAGRERRELTKALGAYGFSGACMSGML
jgi:flagellum-specific peptidoglycan hydrolase FlgJ